jgi:hypothetical protein
MKQRAVQLSLLEEDNQAPLVMAGLVVAVKAAMNRAAERCTLSREQIADRMNHIALIAGVRMTKGNARKISAATLEKWLNPVERGHVPSLLAVNIFCRALGDAGPLAVQLQAHGLEIMTEEDRKLLDYGKACAQAKKAGKAKRKLEEELG